MCEVEEDKSSIRTAFLGGYIFALSSTFRISFNMKVNSINIKAICTYDTLMRLLRQNTYNRRDKHGD